MKKSHRKDVIIARIIFAVVCVLLIAVIVGAVFWLRGRAKDGSDGSESQPGIETEDSQQGADSAVGDVQTTEPVTLPEDTQIPEAKPIMRTTSGVNLRMEPNTDCEVITVLEAGTMLEMLGEEAGWAAVDYQGQTGYVSLDYLEEVTADGAGTGAGDESTAGE